MFDKLSITPQGLLLISKVAFQSLQFSKFAVGNGQITEDTTEIKDLINSIKSFELTSISEDSDTQVTVRGLFKNDTITQGFYLREFGLYAKNPDTEEDILFAYINYRDKADYIDVPTSTKVEYYYQVPIAIDNAGNITIIVSSSTTYVTKQEFDVAMNNKVDKETGKRLMTEAEGTKLSGLENYDDTELRNSKANKKKVWNIAIDTTWTGTTAPYTKTVSVEGITANDIANLELIHSDNIETAKSEVEQFSKISKIVSNAGSVTLTCYEEKPEIALNARIEVMY